MPVLIDMPTLDQPWPINACRTLATVTRAEATIEAPVTLIATTISRSCACIAIDRLALVIADLTCVMVFCIDVTN